MPKEIIKIQGAREHNLKNINLDIPRDKLVVLYRIVRFRKIVPWRLIPFMRTASGGMWKACPPMPGSFGADGQAGCGRIDGLSPAISIDQKTTSRNPRSTVGTVTEIYDYLRLMYASVSGFRTVRCAARRLSSRRWTRLWTRCCPCQKNPYSGFGAGGAPAQGRARKRV